MSTTATCVSESTPDPTVAERIGKKNYKTTRRAWNDRHRVGHTGEFACKSAVPLRIWAKNHGRGQA